MLHSAEQLNTQYWLQQPLTQPLPSFQIQQFPLFQGFNTNVQTLQGTIERVTRHWLQSSVMTTVNGQTVTNPLRVYLFNQMSFNNYNNQDWFSLIGSIGQAVEFLWAKQPSVDINTIIATATQNTGKFYIYRAVSRDPDLRRYVGQQQAAELNIIANEGQQMATAIADFQQERRNAGFGAPLMQGIPQAQQPNTFQFAPVAGQQAPQQANGWGQNMAPGLFGGGTQTPTGFQFQSLSPMTAAVPQPAQTMTPFGVVNGKDTRVSGGVPPMGTQPMVAPTQPAPQPFTPPTNIAAQERAVSDEWASISFNPDGTTEVKGVNAPFDENWNFAPPQNIDTTYDNVQPAVTQQVNDLTNQVQQPQPIVPVVIAQAVPTSETVTGYSPVVDPVAQEATVGKVVAKVTDYQHFPLICYATHQIVGENIVERPMNYNDIETNTDLHIEEEKGKHIPLYREATDDSNVEYEPAGVVDFSKPVIIPDLLTNINSESALNSLKYLHDIYTRGTVLEFTNLSPMAILVASREALERDCSGLFIGKQETDVTQLRRTLGTAIGHSQLLFEQLDARGTEAINKILAVSIGLDDITIDSFYEDWGDLIPALQRRGEAVFEAFRSQLSYIVNAVACLAPEKLERFLIDTSFDQMVPAELSGIRIGTDGELAYDTPQVIGTRRKALRNDTTRQEITRSAVVLLDGEYNALVSTNENDLSLNTPGAGDIVILSKDLCEPLYNYVTEVFERKEKNQASVHYNRVVLSTYEGTRFEVMPTALGEPGLFCLYRY